MSTSQNIVLVGCGKMGSALLHSWLKAKIGAKFTVIEPNDLAHKKIKHYRHIPEAIEQIKAADAIILALKPQTLSEACKQLKPLVAPRTLVLSIAAGKSLASLATAFGARQPIIRSMPNTPAAIGKGITVAVSNDFVTGVQKQLASTLLKSTGHCEWVEDEKLLDAVTALSGSGPAYVFYLIEVLAAAGRKNGLKAELAMKLARQTVIGSAALAEAESASPASELRYNVTSPGGTTEAALNVLMDGRIQAVFDDALAAAKKRGKELNS